MLIGNASFKTDILGTAGDDVLVGYEGLIKGQNDDDWIYIFNPAAAVQGGLGDDTIYGSPGDDEFNLNGNEGADRIYGLDGNDKIEAKGGDIVYGGVGDDILFANGGSNELHGGPGANLFRITETDTAERQTIYDFDLDEGNEIRFEKDQSDPGCHMGEGASA